MITILLSLILIFSTIQLSCLLVKIYFEVRMSNNLNLVLTKPKLEDYSSFLEMSRGIYLGVDYMIHNFKYWIQEEIEGGDRINIGNVY